MPPCEDGLWVSWWALTETGWAGLGQVPTYLFSCCGRDGPTVQQVEKLSECRGWHRTGGPQKEEKVSGHFTSAGGSLAVP